MKRVAVTLLILAALIIGAGCVLGGMVERLATDIQMQRSEVLDEVD